jgi:hypothetical protein
MKKIISTITDSIKKIIKNILYSENKIFYGRYQARFNPFFLLLMNLWSPGRTLIRFKYKSIYRPFIKLSNITDDYDYSDSYISKKSFCDNKHLAVRALKKNGFVVIEEYYSNKLIDKFVDLHSHYVSTESSDNYSSSDILPFSLELKDLWLDENIISVLREMNNGKLFCRNYPIMAATNPIWDSVNYSYERNQLGSKFSDEWHVDHSVLIQPTILLNDVDENTSHMVVIPGSHRFFNVGFFPMSEEYVREFNLPVAPIIGGKGSVAIHCGNIMHKLYCKKYQLRLFIKTEFTPGPNILFNTRSISKLLSGQFDYDDLKKILSGRELEIMSGLLPKSPSKGIEPTDDWFKTTRFRGI